MEKLKNLVKKYDIHGVSTTEEFEKNKYKYRRHENYGYVSITSKTFELNRKKK